MSWFVKLNIINLIGIIKRNILKQDAKLLLI